MPSCYHERDIEDNTNVINFRANITTVNTIAERLKQAREAAGLTQGELAARAGVTQGTIGNVESGLRQNPRELLAIAAALNVSAAWLKTGRGPMAAHPEPVRALSTGEPLPPAFQTLPAPPPLDEALIRIGRELARDMPDYTRDDLADEMSKWVKRSGADNSRKRVAQLLTEIESAGTGTHGKPS